MMQIPLNARRLSAIALAVALLGLLYWLTFHIGFVAPLLRIDEEDRELQSTYLRFAKLEAQRETIKARLQAASESPVMEGSLLSGPEPENAQAQVMQLVVDRLALQPGSGLPCSVLNRVPGAVSEEGRLTRITLDAELECGPEALAETLHRLESEAPFLLVETLDVRRLDAGSGAEPGLNRLRVQLQLQGYVARGEGAGHE